MSNHQDSFLLKLIADYFLNQEVISDVDVSCGLIDQYNLSLLKHCPANANELLLASREAVIANFAI
jgi:hypothetical protein